MPGSLLAYSVSKKFSSHGVRIKLCESRGRCDLRRTWSVFSAAAASVTPCMVAGIASGGSVCGRLRKRRAVEAQF